MAMRGHPVRVPLCTIVFRAFAGGHGRVGDPPVAGGEDRVELILHERPEVPYDPDLGRPDGDHPNATLSSLIRGTAWG